MSDPIGQGMDSRFFFFEFQFLPLVLFTVDIGVKMDPGMDFVLLEFDFQMKDIVLMDSEKVIGNRGEGSPQKALLSYSHVSGFKPGNLKRKKRLMFKQLNASQDIFG
jgi:hypothetical protein